MREKPDFPDQTIIQLLLAHYGLRVVDIAFQPRSGDINAAVYRVTTCDDTRYFLKLLRGVLDETSVRIPRFLYDQGIPQVIAPIVTLDRQLWTRLADFNVILYPYIEGHNAFEAPLTEAQWVEFGAALRRIHGAILPLELAGRVEQERYSPQWHPRVKALIERAQRDTFEDPIAAQYAVILAARANEILSIVQKAERLGEVTRAQAPPSVLCHSDLHAGNLLIGADASLFIVDWDHPILAPRERDLMFIGGGVGSAWYKPQEGGWFYRGYSPVEIDPVALAYYRFERIVLDLAEWGELILLSEQGGIDRARALGGLQRWFSPHDVVAMAYQAEQSLPLELRAR